MKRYVKRIAIVLLSGLLFFSGFQLYDIYRDKKSSEDIFYELENLNEDNEQGNDPRGQLQSAVSDRNDKQDTSSLKYQEIAQRNHDFIGWISIQGTTIDYPVMQTVDRPEYYLTRDFYGDFNKHGVPFAAEDCDVTAPSDNITIYGHHMKDGTMFSDLDKYKQQEYYKEHSIVQFNTLTSCNPYKIIAAFKTVAYSADGFRYYEFHDAKNEGEFNEYVNQVKKRAFYDTGEMATYGDKLLTLSTCEYSQKNGRVVVVAKLIKN